MPIMSGSPDPCVIVIFGASGDLAARKLIPALYEMAACEALPDATRVLGVSRTEMTDDAWREKLQPWVKEHAARFDDAAWAKFARRMHYFSGSAADADVYPGLTERITVLSNEAKCGGNILFYLSVAPNLYEPIVERIGESGLVTEGRKWCSIDRENVPWQRVVNARGEISTRREPGIEPIQQQLLEGEGVEFDRSGRLDLARVQWRPRR